MFYKFRNLLKKIDKALTDPENKNKFEQERNKLKKQLNDLLINNTENPNTLNSINTSLDASIESLKTIKETQNEKIKLLEAQFKDIETQLNNILGRFTYDSQYSTYTKSILSILSQLISIRSEIRQKEAKISLLKKKTTDNDILIAELTKINTNLQ